MSNLKDIDFTMGFQKFPNGFIEVDEKGIIIKANETAIQLFKDYEGDTIIGKSISIIIEKYEKIDKISDGMYNLTIGEKNHFVVPFDLMGESNEKLKGILIINALADSELISRLTTEKKLSRDLEEILEGSFDGILVTDGDGKVLFVNDSYERVAEIKKSDLEGKYMRDLINPVWMPNSVAYVVAEQKTTVSKRQTVKSGRHIIVTGRPIFGKDEEIKKIVINARDITEIYDLSEELQKSKQTEKMYLDRMSDFSAFDENKTPILAVSKAMQDVLQLAQKVGNFHATVLVLGESGVGKEEVAKYIHQNSLRKKGPFIAINCGAIPDNLLESELFGYERGAFTGAMQTGKEGLLEAAKGGTVFLDEIGETPLDFQVKLLRFLETKEVRKVGSVVSKVVDARVIAATNRDLTKMIEEGKFREDLFYRLNVVQIDVPPLRKRVDDIMPLACLFLQKYNKKYNQEKILTYDVVRELEEHPWTGNVRELKNVIENMVIVSNNDYLQTEDLPWYTSQNKGQKEKIINIIAQNDELSLAEATEELEKIILKRTKESCRSTREMANKLNVNQSTIVRKLQKYHLE
ncbi:MAG: sigma 54-interacting transcriptional regulator [Anaerovoracaceae bacterium]